MIRAIMPFLLFLLAACSQPDYNAIRHDFETSHPRCTVNAVTPGEGDSDNVYVRIKYTCQGNPAEKEEVWLYQRKDGEWRKVVRVSSTANNSYQTRSRRRFAKLLSQRSPNLPLHRTSTAPAFA